MGITENNAKILKFGSVINLCVMAFLLGGLPEAGRKYHVRGNKYISHSRRFLRYMYAY